MKGHIRKTKDGRWVGVVYLGKDTVTGKKKYKWIYGDSRKEVQKKVNELIYQIENNIYVNPENITVGEYLDEWLKVYAANLAPTTASLYKMYIEKHIKPYLGKIKLQKLMPIQIQNFYNEKLKEQKGKTVRKYHCLLHRALEDAVRNNLILNNPCKNVTPPKSEKYTPNIYTEEEFAKLLDLVKGTFDEVAILLAGGLGLRRGEVFGLKWSDIDWENKRITIRQTKVRFDKLIEKGPKSEAGMRTIAVPDFILNVLREYRKKQGFESEYVCDKYKPDSYSEHFTKLLDKHGLKHIRFHDLRHYNATIMLKYGIPDKIASKRLGHASVSITREIYQHVLDDMDKSAAEKIDALLKERR